MSEAGVNAEQPWLLWQDGIHSPAFNMALDEALLLQAATLGQPLLRLYEWDRPAITFGYIQSWSKVPQDLPAIRRITGGGVVFHARQFTYTVVLPPTHPIVTRTKAVESYHVINRCVQGALALARIDSQMSSDEISRSVDRASMVCFAHPTRYDLVQGDAKLAGAAQRRMREGLLHQGTIELTADLSPARLRELLPRGFARELGITLDPFLPSPALLDRARELELSRYGSQAWQELR